MRTMRGTVARIAVTLGLLLAGAPPSLAQAPEPGAPPPEAAAPAPAPGPTPSNGSAADPAFVLMGLSALADSNPEAALAEIDRILRSGSLDEDLRTLLDVNAFAADILNRLGRTAEAAQIWLEVGFAVQARRDTLDIDPTPWWRNASRAFEAAGLPARAIEAEEAILAQQRDGSLPPERLAATLDRLATLAEAAGDPARAEAYRAQVALLAPSQTLGGGLEAPAPGGPATRGLSAEGFTRVEVFYATDRARTGDVDPIAFYGSGRGPLELGVAEVTIPDDHVPGAIEAPSIWRLEFGPDPTRHVALQSVEPLDPDPFYARMQARMSAGDDPEAVVFIHGYNTSFDEAARRAAQLAYDMNYPGVPILYSWPSRGTTVGYVADAAVVQLSARRLSHFLDDLVARSGARRIHIVAHSMGNRALTEALELMALRDGIEAGDPPVLGQVIFAAPDVDAGLFAEMLPTFAPLAERLTLYASENDWALAASRRLHGDLPRAGQAGVDTLAVAGLDSVDMSELGEDMLAHGYFADDSSALADLVALLWRSTPPGNRCGLAEVASGDQPTWRYVAGDCPDREIIAVMNALQVANVETSAEARSEVERIVTDPLVQDEVEPVVLRMFEE